MRFSLRWLVAALVVAVAAPVLSLAQEVTPRFTSVEPALGMPGTEITVAGEHIGKAVVAELYFTDGTNDIKTPMLSQTDTTITCKIPAGVKTGVRYRLMVLTRGKEPRLIEQPVRVEIGEPESEEEVEEEKKPPTETR
ncbi:MAG: IPT/TIG domain-containing protein [Bryobacteraceae bacterium]|nr:IPT/TIG domain-containing protein [Bryobacteraceae bacterium]